MLITNMIWKQLSDTNSLIMITTWLYLWILHKSAKYQLVQIVSSVDLGALYLHDVAKLPSVPYRSLSN